MSALAFIVYGVLCFGIGYLAGMVNSDMRRRLIRPTKERDSDGK